MLEIWFKTEGRASPVRERIACFSKGYEYDRVLVIVPSLNLAEAWLEKGLHTLSVAEPGVIAHSPFLENLTARDLVILDDLGAIWLRDAHLMVRVSRCKASIWGVASIIPAGIPAAMTMEITCHDE